MRGVAVLAAGALLFGLTGCTDQVGSAATVGGVQIAESTVLTDSTDLAAGAAAAQSAAPATPQLDVRQLENRQVLTYRIRHQLLESAASRLGVTVDEAQVTEALKSGTANLATQLGVPESLVPQAVRDTLTVLALAEKKATATEPTQAVTDVKATITEQKFATRAEAVTAKAKADADPASFTGEGSAVTLISSAGRQLAPYGVFQVPDGTFLLVEQPSQDGWFVVRVDGRTETQQSDVATALQSMIQSQDQAGALWLSWVALAPYVTGVQIDVNPRFGAWDPLSLQVVPALGS